MKYSDIGKETPLDRILRAWLKDDLDILSPTDQEILERISEVDKRFRKGYTIKKKAVDEMNGREYKEKLYKRPYRKKELADWQVKRFGISLRQAYEDIRMAEQFFLFNEGREDKEFGRGQQIMWGTDLMHQAAYNGDFRAASAFFKELNKLKGLDKPDDFNFDPSKFEPINPIIVTDVSEVGFEKLDDPNALVAELRKSFKQSVLDKFMNDAEDVEEEEGDPETGEA